jgi:hypothetical protein
VVAMAMLMPMASASIAVNRPCGKGHHGRGGDPGRRRDGLGFEG